MNMEKIQKIKINGWNGSPPLHLRILIIRFVTKTLTHTMGSGLRLQSEKEGRRERI